MDAGTLIALTGLITAIGAIATALISSRSKATIDDLASLRETVKLLQDENKRIIFENDKLRERINLLEGERTSNRERITMLEEQVQDLEEQVRRMGGTPVTNFTARRPPQ